MHHTGKIASSFVQIIREEVFVLSNNQIEISRVIKKLYEQMVDNDQNNEVGGYLTDIERSVKNEICEHENEEYMKIMMWLEELKQYRDLEEQGLLFRLPVKIRQILYTNIRMQGRYFRVKDAPYRVEVALIGLDNANDMDDGFFNVVYENHSHMMQFNFSDIGKTIFLTQSGAEEKLRELRERRTKGVGTL